MNWLLELRASDVLSIVSTALAVISIGLAIYFYVKQKQSKTPRYSLATNQIISREKISSHQLSVTFAGQPVDNLVIAKLAFWNAGNVAMRRSDCAGDTCIQIKSTKECRIIDAVLLKASCPENGVEKAFDEATGTVGVDFEFLRPHEGFVLSLAYEGLAVHRPTVSQTMIDGRALQQTSDISLFSIAIGRGRRMSSVERAKFQRGFYFAVILVGVGLVIGPMLYAFWAKEYSALAMSPVGVLYFALGITARPRVPRDLQDVYLG